MDWHLLGGWYPIIPDTGVDIMTSGLTYPYTKYDRLLGDKLDLDLEFSPGPTPPSGTAGGAGKFKYWVDTSTTLPSLRQCIAPRATAGVYVPAEWITLGTIDAVGHKFHFNTDDIDVTGGTGTLTVNNITVTGASTLTTLTVTGPSTLSTLSVTGATSLHALSVTGDIAATGNISTPGNISGGSLNISGTSTLQNLTVTGSLTTSSGGLSIAGPITSTGATAAILFYDRTLTTHYWAWFADNDIAYLQESPAGVPFLTVAIATGVVAVSALTVANTSVLHNTAVTGSLTVSGTASVGSTLAVVSGISSASLTATGAINGGSLNTAGAASLGNTSITGTLGVTSTLGVTGAITGASLTVSGAITSASLTCSTATASTFDGIVLSLRSRLFANTDTTLGLTGIYEPDGGVVIGIYATGATGGPTAGMNVYHAESHNFHNRNNTLGFAVFTSAGTANQSGSWIAICDDTVKDNVTPYTIGLTEILQLNPVSFNYSVPEADGAHWSPFADPVGTTTPKVHYGLMASQVQPVIPEMVHEATFMNVPQGLPATPLLTIAPTHLVYVLTNAVKTLAAQDESLTDRLDAVEASHAVYAPLASPAFTGLPTAPTPTRNTSSTRLATTEFVRVGTDTNDSAITGQIGEFQAGQVLSTAAIVLTTAVDTGVVALLLTAGDWEVHASVGFNMTNGNNVTLKTWINPTGAATAPSIDQTGGHAIMSVSNNTPLVIIPVTAMRVSLATVTTIRLGVTAIIGGGTVAAWGKLMARRMR